MRQSKVLLLLVLASLSVQGGAHAETRTFVAPYDAASAVANCSVNVPGSFLGDSCPASATADEATGSLNAGVMFQPGVVSDVLPVAAGATGSATMTMSVADHLAIAARSVVYTILVHVAKAEVEQAQRPPYPHQAPGGTVTLSTSGSYPACASCRWLSQDVTVLDGDQVTEVHDQDFVVKAVLANLDGDVPPGNPAIGIQLNAYDSFRPPEGHFTIDATLVSITAA